MFWVLFLDHLTANNLPVISWTQIIRKWSVFVMSFPENTKWVFSSIMPVSIIVSDRFTLQAKKYFYLSFTVIRFYNNSFSNNQTTLNLISFFVALFDMCRCRIVPFPVFLSISQSAFTPSKAYTTFIQDKKKLWRKRKGKNIFRFLPTWLLRILIKS